MKIKSSHKTSKFLYGFTLAGMILSLCFGMGGLHPASARAPQDETPSEPPMTGSLPVQDQAWTQTGWFSVIWGDGKDGSSPTVYTLTDDAGQTTFLNLDEALARSLGGVLSFDRKYVSVQGAWAAPFHAQSASAAIDVTSISLAVEPGKQAPADITPLAVTGSRPWVSILCKFSDYSTTESKNLAYFQGMYSSTKPGMDHYWREQSYNMANVAGSTAFGWFVLPHPEAYYNPTDTLGGTNLTTLANDCTAAADPSVNFSPYTGINMMFNTDFDNGYAWGGSMYLTLDGGSKLYSTTWEPPWGYSDITVIAHEMGHGFGLPHSSGAYGQTYDNQWDVMSDTWSNCGNATDATYGCLGQGTISYHKDILGWIPAGQKFTAGSNINTTITLEQLDLPQTSNYLMAQIPIGGSSTHFYTVEARRKTGYDVKLPGEAVIIHDVDTSRGIPAHVIDIDGNGNTGDAGAMWTVGETFLDAANGISVYVLAATSTGFQVTITTGGISTAPIATTGSATSLTSTGATLNGTVNANNSSTTVTFQYGLTTGYGTTVTAAQSPVTGTSSTAVSAAITGLTPSTLYHFRVVAVNAGGTTNGLDGTFTTLTGSAAQVLLVDDDDNNPDVRSYYTAALTALGKTYDVWDTNNSDNEPGAAALDSYAVVIWFTGHEYGGYAGPGSAGESALGAWLGAGGCFLLSSQDYYYDRGTTSFASTYLGVGSETNDVAQSTVTGAGNVFSGLGPFTLSYPFTNYSEIIVANATAETAFGGDKGSAALDKNNGTYRTVYLGFPFEAISALADRQQVMSRFINWCALPYRVYLPVLIH